jgi:hypothetical protein
MEIDWPDRAAELLRVSVKDVVAFRDHLQEKNVARPGGAQGAAGHAVWYLSGSVVRLRSAAFFRMQLISGRTPELARHHCLS